MPRQIEGSQTDFSYGEVDVALKRNDAHPARKGGLRQMANARILNAGGIQNRPGRRALQIATNRVEEITIAPGIVYRLEFTPSSSGTLHIYDTNGTLVLGQGNLGFNAFTIPLLTWAVFQNSLYLAGPGLQPLMTTWTAPNTWPALAGFNGAQTAGGQFRRFFYRITPKGITMQPSGTTGNITVQFSDFFLRPGHINTLMRYCNRQIFITSLNSTSNCNATVVETLPSGQTVNAATDPRVVLSLGDVVIGSVSGAQGQVVTLTSSTVGVQLLSTAVTAGIATGGSGPIPVDQPSVSVTGFVAADLIVGPGGSVQIASLSSIGSPNAVTYWDEELMNNFQGWPACVFADQSRLGFCNFPLVPNAIGWSAIGSPADHYIGANPSDAMLELVPDKVQVFFIVPGPESSEFVFCDKRVYYIAISATNPLRPGSVGFQVLSSDGAAQVQPRVSQEIVLYVNAGQNSMMAIVATGAYQRPFSTKNLTEFHSHLFTNIIAIAVPTADGQFNERYAYVVNADGSIIVGKYSLDAIAGNAAVAKIGWGPWSGVGTCAWVSARDAVVLMVMTYPGTSLLEVIDDTYFVDASVLVNAVPAALAPPGGLGPLWFWINQTVTLMDQGTRAMGTYQIDATGHIVPQFNGGENLSLSSLVAGQPWTMTAEPFAPIAQPGVDMHQRMELRQISKIAAYVVNSTGLLFQALFNSKQTKTSPPLGTPMSERRVPAWNVDDDATKPPTQRETVESWTPQGSSFDPRVAIVKDTPGPLLIAEIAMEVTI